MISAIAEPLRKLADGLGLLIGWMLGSTDEHREPQSIQRYGESWEVDEIEVPLVGAFFSGKNAFCKELGRGNLVSRCVVKRTSDLVTLLSPTTIYAAALQATEHLFDSQL